MTVDIGRVFSNSWEMVKQRFWILLGMWALFFAVQMVFSTVFTAVLGGSMFALGAAAGGLDDPNMLMAGGFGIGFILFTIIFYLGYIVIMLAQQCAMAALASPLDRVAFGDAFRTSFRAGLTFFGVTLLLVIAYFAFALAGVLVAALLSMLGDAGAIIAGILIVPAVIYLVLRLSVIVPVVAVDRTFNPVQAIRRTWQMTGGNVLAILVVSVISLVIALALLGIPIALMFGSLVAIGSGSTDPAAALGAMGSIIGGVLLLFPLFIVYSIVSVVINVCLHAEMTDSQTARLEETFS